MSLHEPGKKVSRKRSASLESRKKLVQVAREKQAERLRLGKEEKGRLIELEIKREEERKLREKEEKAKKAEAEKVKRLEEFEVFKEKLGKIFRKYQLLKIPAVLIDSETTSFFDEEIMEDYFAGKSGEKDAKVIDSYINLIDGGYKIKAVNYIQSAYYFLFEFEEFIVVDPAREE